MGPSPIAVSMKEEKGRYWAYCNYCGENVPFGEAGYNHVIREHAAQVHAGPGEFDPKRNKRADRVFLVGMALTVPIHVSIIVLLSDLMHGIGFWLFITSFLTTTMGLFIFTELYKRRWRKSPEEILKELMVVCETCGARIPFKDLSQHTEVHHPEEYAVDRRVYDPFGKVFTALVFGGIGGMMLSLFFSDSDGDNFSREGWILLLVSAAVLVTGVVMGYLFEKLYHEPRMKRLAREWDERHPGSRKE